MREDDYAGDHQEGNDDHQDRRRREPLLSPHPTHAEVQHKPAPQALTSQGHRSVAGSPNIRRLMSPEHSGQPSRSQGRASLPNVKQGS